jgi:hypothetical protein
MDAEPPLFVFWLPPAIMASKPLAVFMAPPAMTALFAVDVIILS